MFRLDSRDCRSCFLCASKMNKFVKSVFTPKTQQMFFVQNTRLEKTENVPITDGRKDLVQALELRHLGLITWVSRGSSCSKCFRSTLKRKGGVVEFLRFEERFRKASFSVWISEHGRGDRKNKVAF